jgi:hypothetical protein
MAGGKVSFEDKDRWPRVKKHAAREQAAVLPARGRARVITGPPSRNDGAMVEFV